VLLLLRSQFLMSLITVFCRSTMTLAFSVINLVLCNAFVGLQLVGVAVSSSPRQARVYDLNTGDVIATLDEAAAAAVAAGTAGGGSSAAAGATGGGAAAGGGEFVRGNASACFSPSGE
jgi:hypothetical protein